MVYSQKQDESIAREEEETLTTKVTDTCNSIYLKGLCYLNSKLQIYLNRAFVKINCAVMQKQVRLMCNLKIPFVQSEFFICTNNLSACAIYFWKWCITSRMRLSVSQAEAIVQ